MSFIDYKPIGKFTGEKHSVLEDGVVYTKEWLDYKEQRRLEIILPSCNIPNHIIPYSLEENYIGNVDSEPIKKIKKYISNFENTFYNKPLYVYGVAGTQKTTVCQYIGKELIRKKKTVKFTTMNKLIYLLTNEQFKEEVKQEIEEIRQSDLIILDRSFDKEQVTVYQSGYQLAFLDSFLRERIEFLQKAIIIISNNAIEEISKNKFNKDIEDLIKRSTVPYGLAIEFKDHYSLKDDFDASDLWKD